MATPNSDTLSRAAEPGPARFNLLKLAAFLPIGLVVGGLIGGAAAHAQTYFAPLVIFPVLVGFVLGGLLVIFMRVANTGHRGTVVVVTILAIATTTAATHYVCYQFYVRSEPTRRAAMVQAAFGDDAGMPSSFADYLEREANRGRTIFGQHRAQGVWVWITWAVDGLLLGAAALAVVIMALRLPYCDQCRTWYRATRIGRLKPANGVLVGSAALIAMPEKPHSVRYRLLNCLGACGPTGLELMWRDDDGQSVSNVAWLTPDARDHVVQILDHRTGETGPAS
jgi:hypothetical protein